MYEEGDQDKGAGIGVNLVKQILHNYTTEEEPIKLIFYPDFFKIGFKLKRSELVNWNNYPYPLYRQG